MNDGAVSFSYFKRALKALNPRLTVNFDSGSLHRGVMVYLRIPKHPDSDPITGLWEVLAVPSPLYYRHMPKHDVEWIEPGTGKGKWVRGWSTFFKDAKRLRDPWGRKIFSADKVKAWFDRPYDKFDSGKYKRDLNERNRSGAEKMGQIMKDNRYIFDPKQMPSEMGA